MLGRFEKLVQIQYRLVQYCPLLAAVLKSINVVRSVIWQHHTMAHKRMAP